MRKNCPKRNKQILPWALLTILSLTALFVYFRFNPAESAFFPKCIFLQLTGFKCPGCGSQRAIHCLLHFDIPGAFRFNALLVMSIPLLVLMTFFSVFKQRFTKWHNALSSLWLISIVFVATIAWWILRNVYGW